MGLHCLVARADCVIGRLVLPAGDRWNKKSRPRSPAGLGMPDQCLLGGGGLFEQRQFCLQAVTVFDSTNSHRAPQHLLCDQMV